MAFNSTLAFDPVCGMWLEESQVAVTYTYLSQTYAFCCTECRDLFAQDASTFLILLAHEPGESMGHRCPLQRQSLAGEDKGAASLPLEGRHLAG